MKSKKTILIAGLKVSNSILLFTIYLTLSVNVFCQTNQNGFPVLKGKYLGQKPPGTTPEIFAPGIISTEKGWEAAISFSPDLSELFFSYRATNEGADNRVMQMKMVNNIWTKPKLAPFARDIMEYEAFITPDNKKVIFKSTRPNPAGTTKEGGIWYSEKENGNWSEARYFSGAINEGWIMSVTSSLDCTLYFTGSSKEDYGIFKSRLVNGEYTKPEFLPKEINKSRYFGASHPFIAPDESYIIFDAEGFTNSDLFICYKKQDGTWTDAVRLGQDINTIEYEGIATVSPDGKYLFFQRNNDIYWVSAKFIEELRLKE